MRAIDAPADAMLLEAEGVLGRSFSQADKAIKNSEWAVRDGGCLVLQAPCPDGIGQDDFMRLLGRCRNYDAALAEVRGRGYRLGDHKGLKLRYLTDRRGVRLFLISEGLSDDQARVLGAVRAGSADEALAAGRVAPASARVYRVADAANTCITVAEGFDNPPTER
jgi:hypothetical protein